MWASDLIYIILKKQLRFVRKLQSKCGSQTYSDKCRVDSQAKFFPLNINTKYPDYGWYSLNINDKKAVWNAE